MKLNKGTKAAQTGDVCANKHDGNELSLAAHKGAIGRAPKSKALILTAIENSGDGLTVTELTELLEMPYTTVSARVSELKMTELLIDSGRRRKTSTGRMSAVLTLPGQCKEDKPKRRPRHWYYDGRTLCEKKT